MKKIRTHFPEGKYLSVPSFISPESSSGICKKLFINSLIGMSVVPRKVHHVRNTIALGQLTQAKLLGCGTG